MKLTNGKASLKNKLILALTIAPAIGSAPSFAVSYSYEKLEGLFAASKPLSYESFRNLVNGRKLETAYDSSHMEGVLTGHGHFEGDFSAPAGSAGAVCDIRFNKKTSPELVDTFFGDTDKKEEPFQFSEASWSVKCSDGERRCTGDPKFPWLSGRASMYSQASETPAYKSAFTTYDYGVSAETHQVEITNHKSISVLGKLRQSADGKYIYGEELRRVEARQAVFNGSVRPADTGEAFVPYAYFVCDMKGQELKYYCG